MAEPAKQAQLVYEAAMAWQDADRSESSTETFMFVSVGRDSWPEFLRVVEQAWEERRRK